MTTAANQADFDLRMRQIDAQLVDYAKAIDDYAAFMADYRERNDPAQKRVARFRKAAEAGAA